MFKLVSTPISAEALLETFNDLSAGGLVSFAGIVRNNNDGFTVKALEYEAFESLAVSEGAKIISEAREMFAVKDVVAVHRQGFLNIGEIAVWIGVDSAHRDPAFKACRYIIDEIKDRLPIWKKEHYLDQPSQWINCQGCYHGHSSVKVMGQGIFSRQQKLKFVGKQGQAQLEQARVLVVGMGGLGVPAASYLASAGIGHLTLIDHDNLEGSNLHRQPIYSWLDIGKPKVTLAKEKLQSQVPGLSISAVAESLTADNVAQLVEDHDVVLDCTDNFSSKFLIHDVCFVMDKPLVQASVYQLEGQIQVFSGKHSQAGCFRCLWPEGLSDGCVGNCEEAGVLGPVPGVLGTLQALETLKILLNRPSTARNHTVFLDLDSLSQFQVERSKADHCPLCGNASQPTLESVLRQPEDLDEEITVDKLKPQDLIGIQLVDIREPDEICQKEEKFNLNYLHAGYSIDPKKPALLICQRGQRSLKMCRDLRDKNFDVVSLRGGMPAFKRWAEGQVNF